MGLSERQQSPSPSDATVLPQPGCRFGSPRRPLMLRNLRRKALVSKGVALLESVNLHNWTMTEATTKRPNQPSGRFTPIPQRRDWNPCAYAPHQSNCVLISYLIRVSCSHAWTTERPRSVWRKGWDYPKPCFGSGDGSRKGGIGTLALARPTSRTAFSSPILFAYPAATRGQRNDREVFGGRGGIRTHGEFNPTLDFESSALNRTQPPFP